MCFLFVIVGSLSLPESTLSILPDGGLLGFVRLQDAQRAYGPRKTAKRATPCERGGRAVIEVEAWTHEVETKGTAQRNDKELFVVFLLFSVIVDH